MKKLLIPLAVAGLFASAANAQSTLTTYGIVDMGLVIDDGARSVEKLSSGVQSGSRLGFKGTEDLGNNLKALFVLETGINADAGGFSPGNVAFARQSFVGVQGDFGTVTLGRQYSPLFLTLNQVADPFASGLAGNAQNLMPHAGVRMDNTIKYVTPVIAQGITGELAYGFGESTTAGDGANRQYGVALGFSQGPANLRAAYHRKNDATDTAHNSYTLLAANWNLEVAKVFVALSDNSTNFVDSTNSRQPIGESRDYLVGVSVPLDKHTFTASYIHKDGRSTTIGDANQLGLGYTYALSKRTNLYAAWAKIDNKGVSAFTVGNNSELGTGDKAFNLGVRHLF